MNDDINSHRYVSFSATPCICDGVEAIVITYSRQRRYPALRIEYTLTTQFLLSLRDWRDYSLIVRTKLRCMELLLPQLP